MAFGSKLHFRLPNDSCRGRLPCLPSMRNNVTTEGQAQRPAPTNGFFVRLHRRRKNVTTEWRTRRSAPTNGFDALTPPSHTWAPVLQLQINAGAAAEDIEGWAVGDIDQAAGADLVVPLFRAEAQCLKWLARARELNT